MDELDQLAQLASANLVVGVGTAREGQFDSLSPEDLGFLSGWLFAFSDVLVQASLGESSTVEDSLAVAQKALNDVLDPRSAFACMESMQQFVATNMFLESFGLGLDSGTEDVNDKLHAISTNSGTLGTGTARLRAFLADQ